MSQVMILADDNALCACEDCEWKGEASDLDMISDFEERVSAGETVPAGQCPRCGALAHLNEPPPGDAGRSVTVFVSGGAVQKADVPQGVVVTIIDYDIDGADEASLSKDHEGAACTIATYRG